MERGHCTKFSGDYEGIENIDAQEQENTTDQLRLGFQTCEFYDKSTFLSTLLLNICRDTRGSNRSLLPVCSCPGMTLHRWLPKTANPPHPASLL